MKTRLRSFLCESNPTLLLPVVLRRLPFRLAFSDNICDATTDPEQTLVLMAGWQAGRQAGRLAVGT